MYLFCISDQSPVLLKKKHVSQTMQIFKQYYFFVHTNSVKEKYRNWPPRAKISQYWPSFICLTNLSSARRVQGHKTKLNEVRKMYGRVGFANVNLFCLDQIQLLFWIFEFFSKKSSREWKKNCEYVARKDLNAYKNNKLDSNRLKIVNRQDDCSSSWMDWD